MQHCETCGQPLPKKRKPITLEVIKERLDYLVEVKTIDSYEFILITDTGISVALKKGTQHLPVSFYGERAASHPSFDSYIQMVLAQNIGKFK